MKIGKSAAFLIGTSIIAVQVAHEQGWIRIDWSKVTKQLDQVGDKVEEAVTGEGPKWMDKVNASVNCCFFLALVGLLYADMLCVGMSRLFDDCAPFGTMPGQKLSTTNGTRHIYKR